MEEAGGAAALMGVTDFATLFHGQLILDSGDSLREAWMGVLVQGDFQDCMA